MIPVSAFHVWLSGVLLAFQQLLCQKISAPQNCRSDDAALIRGQRSFKFILLWLLAGNIKKKDRTGCGGNHSSPSVILFSIKVTLYDSCQLVWLAQFRIERCVWSSQRSGFDSRSSQAWISQVLFQPVRLFILYWEDHLHFNKVPTQYKAVYFLANLNLSKTIYLDIVTYYKDKNYTLFCLEELQKFIPFRR